MQSVDDDGWRTTDDGSATAFGVICGVRHDCRPNCCDGRDERLATRARVGEIFDMNANNLIVFCLGKVKGGLDRNIWEITWIKPAFTGRLHTGDLPQST